MTDTQSDDPSDTQSQPGGPPSAAPGSNGVEERLQKIIAAAGVASRRKAEELITQGRVQVNGQTVTVLGAKADPARDHIRVDGKLLNPQRPRYLVLNKPKGYVTTVSDPEGRPTVMDLVKSGKAVGGPRLFPVGRLDYTSEGLLLMTNDGELANALTRAAARVEKTYLVKVSGKPSESALQQLRHGIMIDRDTQIGPRGASRDEAEPRTARKTDGRKAADAVSRSFRSRDRVMTAPARIRLLRDADNPWYEMILIEGRNREIRKMFEEIGHHVEKIRRVGYGPLVLDLEPGRSRELTPDEVAALRRAAEGKRAHGSDEKRPLRLPKVPRTSRARSTATVAFRPRRSGDNRPGPRADNSSPRSRTSNARSRAKKRTRSR